MESLDKDLDLVSHNSLKDEVLKLRNAIRSHRDQKGDDRCWMDDIELYKALPEGVAEADLSLLSDEQFRRNCDLFIKNRKCPVPQGITIGQYVMDRLRERAGQKIVIFSVCGGGSGVTIGVLEKVQDVNSFTVYSDSLQSSITVSFIDFWYAIVKIMSREGDILYENSVISRNLKDTINTPKEIENLQILSFGREVAEKLSKTGSK